MWVVLLVNGAECLVVTIFPCTFQFRFEVPVRTPNPVNCCIYKHEMRNTLQTFSSSSDSEQAFLTHLVQYVT
jgi:hypothetical protein